MGSIMISVRGLGMRLASGGRAVDVLSDVTLEVPAGQFLAIAGPSGSGKSTLLGLIAGLDQPTAGHIEVAETEITGLDEDALARFRRDHVGYVFQSFHLIPTLTAQENVAVPLELAGEADVIARAAEAPIQAHQQLDDLLAGGRVEVAGGLVGQEQRGPSRNVTTRSAWAASAASWVTSTSVLPRRRFMPTSSSMICLPVAESRLPVGSSARRIAGRRASARATATRCCSPPESWTG